LNTATCPNCHQKVTSQAISCPYCRTQLKAYGHPGIPLHRAKGDSYLCESCTYHADNSCNFPQRPYAKDCTLYENIEQRQLEKQQQVTSFGETVQSWIKRYQVWLLLLGLLIICLLITLAGS
jgi:hypothetical protein